MNRQSIEPYIDILTRQSGAVGQICGDPGPMAFRVSNWRPPVKPWFSIIFGGDPGRDAEYDLEGGWFIKGAFLSDPEVKFTDAQLQQIDEMVKRRYENEG